MYTMKEACELTGLSYETLKFYCNEGLVPELTRDKNNRRIFEDHQIQWIKGLLCLRDCGMGVAEMKRYITILLSEDPDVPALQEMLDRKQRDLERSIERARESIRFIGRKQAHYNAVRAGERAMFDLRDFAPDGEYLSEDSYEM